MFIFNFINKHILEATAAIFQEEEERGRERGYILSTFIILVKRGFY